MIIELKNGWRDYSSEGPYTEVLLQKDGAKICKYYDKPYFEISFKLSFGGLTEIHNDFETQEEAMAYCETVLNTLVY